MPQDTSTPAEEAGGDEAAREAGKLEQKSSQAIQKSTGSTNESVQTSNVVILQSERLEVRLNLQDLKALEGAFQEPPDEVQKPKSQGEMYRLDRKQFGEKLSKAVKKGTQEEFEELFDRIDITEEGSVSWDMFIQFMLYDFMEKDEKVKTTRVPNWRDLKIIGTPHKDTIQRIQHSKSTNRYLCISREGCITFWDHHVKLQKSFRLTTESVKPRDMWVTDFVLLPTLNKIAVSFTSKEIAFYDLSSKVEFNCQYKLTGLQTTPLCLDFHSNPENANEAILVYGDVGGQVSALCFSSAQIALFDRPQKEAADSKPQDDATVHVKLKDIMRDTSKHKNCRFVHHVCHKGWVRQVKYVEHLECFISCSTGREKTIILGFIEKASTTMRTTSFRFSHGVNCFDYHQQLNLIATGSVNNLVCLWNPYVISKPVGILTGHMAAVVQVRILLNRQQLVTFSVDKVLRIWDIQQQVCLQRLAGIFPKGPEVQTVLYFDEIRNRLFVTFNYQLTVMEMKIEKRDRVMTHDGPVTAAMYNSLYNQVVTAGQDGTLTIWMIDTGQKVKQFTNCHGNHEITTVSFDHSKSRIYTASTDGTVKIWDFNGHCHHMLTAGRNRPADISQVLILHRSILALGWDKYITVFRTNHMTQYHIDPVDWKGGQEHQDDILAGAYSPPATLATGSYDGEIVIWHTHSENCARKLQSRSRTAFGKRSVLGGDTPLRPATSERPTTSESQSTELEFSLVITSLVFLSTRMNAGNPSGKNADLVSCGGAGWVRFWNSGQGTLCSEFLAHPHTGNIRCVSDSENRYLITADSDGLVKAWYIADYLTEENPELETSPPTLHATWQPHTDAINCIDTCVRNNQLLIITASSDCSAALWDINGHKVGEFGQDTHWKIEEQSLVPKQKTTAEDRKSISESEAELSIIEELRHEESFVETASDFDAAQERDFNESAWSATVLGKAYQESRLDKRERKQPGTIHNYKEQVETTAVGPYGILDYNELAPMPSMKKPDFMLHPHKYFGEKPEKFNKKQEDETTPTTREARVMLKAAFDEKTLFSKELLDFEAQIRSEHARKLKSPTGRRSKPMGILKSLVTSNLLSGSNSTSGSKIGSRIGSSVQEKRATIK